MDALEHGLHALGIAKERKLDELVADVLHDALMEEVGLVIDVLLGHRLEALVDRWTLLRVDGALELMVGVGCVTLVARARAGWVAS